MRKLQRHLGITPMIFVQRSGQPYRRRAFHGAKTKDAARLRIAHRGASLIGQRQQPVGVTEQHLAGR